MSSPTRIQRRRTLAADLSTRFAQNRAAVAPKLAGAGLPRRLLFTLSDFLSGEPADPDDLAALARLGLVEMVQDSGFQATRQGRAVWVDANRGNAQAAIRGLEAGRARVKKLAEQALEMSRQAAALHRRAGGERGTVALLGERAGDRAEELAGRLEGRAAASEAEASRLEEQAALIRARIGMNEPPVEEAEMKAILLALDHEKAMAEKSFSSFRAGINSAFRGLWTGNFDDLDFIDAMMTTIRRGFTQAWAEGAKTCGIGLDELSQAEQRALEAAISGQNPYILNLAFDILDLRDGGPFPAELRYRASLWHGRYGEMVEQAKSMACADRKARWTIDPHKQNCASCLRLNGKVKRWSYWRSQGVLPQVAGASYLECRGFKCGCRLVDTDESLSRGPLPGLP